MYDPLNLNNKIIYNLSYHAKIIIAKFLIITDICVFFSFICEKNLNNIKNESYLKQMKEHLCFQLGLLQIKKKQE